MTELRRLAGLIPVTMMLLLVAGGTSLAQETLTRSFPFGSGDRLEMEVEAGDVSYEVGGSGEILIEVITSRGQVSEYLDLEFEELNGGLRIEGDKVGSGSLWSRMFGGGEAPIQFRIVGPDTLEMKLSTAGGDIRLPDVSGQIRVATSGGNIEFGSITGEFKAATSGGDILGDRLTETGSVATSGGDINIREGGDQLKAATSGGDITVEIAHGDVTVATSGGNIELGEIDGDLSARTSGEDIRVGSSGGSLEVASSGGDVVLSSVGGHVDASTSGGDLEVWLVSDLGGEIETSGGTLTVHLPSGAGFDLDADAQGGHLRFEVPVAGRMSEDRAEGTIRGGGNLLRLRNRNGDIRIDAR